MDEQEYDLTIPANRGIYCIPEKDKSDNREELFRLVIQAKKMR